LLLRGWEGGEFIGGVEENITKRERSKPQKEVYISLGNCGHPGKSKE